MLHRMTMLPKHDLEIPATAETTEQDKEGRRGTRKIRARIKTVSLVPLLTLYGYATTSNTQTSFRQKSAVLETGAAALMI